MPEIFPCFALINIKLWVKHEPLSASAILRNFCTARRQIQNTADEEGYQENVPNVPTEEELNYDIEELNLDTGIEECGAPADLAMNELSNQRLKADHNGRTSPTPLTNSHILQGRAQKMLER